MLSQMEWNDFHFLTLFQTPSLLWQFTLICDIWTTVLLLFNLFNNVMSSQMEWLSLSLIVSNTFIISFHFQPWNIRKSTPFPSKEVGPHNLSQRNSYYCSKNLSYLSQENIIKCNKIKHVYSKKLSQMKQIFLQQKYFKFIPRKLMRLFRTNCFVDDTVCPKVLLKREKEIFLLNFLNKTWRIRLWTRWQRDGPQTLSSGQISFG